MSSMFRVLHAADKRRSALLRAVRQRLGIVGAPTVLAYRGYGTTRRARITARVLEHRDVKPSQQRNTVLESAYASYQRYATREIGGAEVRVRWLDQCWSAVTNDEGFIELDVSPPVVPGGWHDIELAIVGSETRTQGHVFIIDDTTEFGVISDIDDTVIETNVTNALRRAHALFLSEARTRLPFDGVGAFYSALHEGTIAGRTNPIFYVSSSPWNLYEHINEFLDIHDIPYGALLLRDWGLSSTGFAPDGRHTHKLQKIRDVLELTAPLSFLLLGDSGQHDPELYEQIVNEYGGRIRCVYIRNASRRKSRAAELEAIGARIQARGTEFVVIDDTAVAARHAASHGWILWREVDHVRQAKQEDEARSG
jgi:phosphatidate phosphatase APP1